MKIGFELELFVTKDDQPVLVPTGLPYDECGWLVELRSEPHWDVRKAIALLNTELADVEEKLPKHGVVLVREPLKEIPRALKVQAARKHTKGLIRYRNIYGHETHRCSTKFATASLHVSFTNEQTFRYTSTSGKAETFKYQGFIDHARIIMEMDRAFKREIKEAGRNPGFYEVKADGRIEYRSLPNNVDLEKLRTTLVGILKTI
jgi:hypothetical protein